MAGTPVTAWNALTSELLQSDGRSVAIAGTAEPLSLQSFGCHEVLIQAKETNTGKIYIGGPNVANNGTNGIVLVAPTVGAQPPSISLSAQNLNEIWLNATVGGEGVVFIWW